MRNFKPGDVVAFGAASDGLPVWNVYQRRDVPWRVLFGRVIRSDRTSIRIQYPYKGRILFWTWPQPNIKKHACWDDAAYLKLKNKQFGLDVVL